MTSSKKHDQRVGRVAQKVNKSVGVVKIIAELCNALLQYSCILTADVKTNNKQSAT